MDFQKKGGRRQRGSQETAVRQTIHFLFKQEILITTKKLKRQNDFKSKTSLGYKVSSSIIYIVSSIIIWTTQKTLSQTKINTKESPCLPNKTKTLNETLLFYQ